MQIFEAQSIRRDKKNAACAIDAKILLKKMRGFENLNNDYNESEI